MQVFNSSLELLVHLLCQGLYLRLRLSIDSCSSFRTSFRLNHWTFHCLFAEVHRPPRQANPYMERLRDLLLVLLRKRRIVFNFWSPRKLKRRYQNFVTINPYSGISFLNVPRIWEAAVTSMKVHLRRIVSGVRLPLLKSCPQFWHKWRVV